MLDLVRYLLDWPRNSDGEVIFNNTHEAIFYAIMVKNMKVLIQEIEVLRIKAKEHFDLEKKKPAPNHNIMMQLSSKHQFYSECIETAQKLFKEQG